MEYTRLAGETDHYREQRERLRRAELELIEHRERIAAMRRALPVGPVVDDYVFLEGPGDLDAGDEPVREVRLSELFTQPDTQDRSLIVYHLMYGKEQTTPCPMCTMWIDGFNGIARHVTENADLVIVAAADVPALRAHARDRGWYGLRLLSCGDNSFKFDLGSEDEKGVQDSTISVFSRDASGAVHHAYSARPRVADDVGERGIDLCCATWHLLDLTPGGRGDWYASLSYG
jgi:predicted dithiol-disulfide oxidoreductase (DUF899 family)